MSKSQDEKIGDTLVWGCGAALVGIVAFVGFISWIIWVSLK